MHFRIEQSVNSPRSSVELAYSTVDFYERLGELGTVSAPQVLKCALDDQNSQITHLKIRYRFAGNLSSAARAVLDPQKLTWVDHADLDTAVHEMRFELVPEHYANRLECKGKYLFLPESSSRTTQIMEGEIEVRFPLVGATVERAIVDGLKKNLAAAASIMENWLEENPR